MPHPLHSHEAGRSDSEGESTGPHASSNSGRLRQLPIEQGQVAPFAHSRFDPKGLPASSTKTNSGLPRKVGSRYDPPLLQQAGGSSSRGSSRRASGSGVAAAPPQRSQSVSFARELSSEINRRLDAPAARSYDSDSNASEMSEGGRRRRREKGKRGAPQPPPTAAAAAAAASRKGRRTDVCAMHVLHACMGWPAKHACRAHHAWGRHAWLGSSMLCFTAAQVPPPRP